MICSDCGEKCREILCRDYITYEHRDRTVTDAYDYYGSDCCKAEILDDDDS